MTEAASREESDIDQTAAASSTRSFGNTQFNTFRVAFTQEDVAFANPNFNANGGHAGPAAADAPVPDLHRPAEPVMQARVNDAYQFDDTFSWFIPGSKGDHSIRAGVQYEYVDVFSTAQDNWNGTFSFSAATCLQRRRSQHLSGPALDPRSRALGMDAEGALLHGFIQDKWKTGNRLTLSLGLRYDIEKIPLPGVDNPKFSDPTTTPGQEQLLASRRFRLRPEGGREDRAFAAATAASTTRPTSS